MKLKVMICTLLTLVCSVPVYGNVSVGDILDAKPSVKEEAEVEPDVQEAYEEYISALNKSLIAKDKTSTLTKKTSTDLSSEAQSGTYEKEIKVVNQQRDSSRVWTTVESVDSSGNTEAFDIYMKNGYLNYSNGLLKVKERISTALELSKALESGQTSNTVSDEILNKYHQWIKVCDFNADAITAVEGKEGKYKFTLDAKKVKFNEDLPFDLQTAQCESEVYLSVTIKSGYLTGVSLDYRIKGNLSDYKAADTAQYASLGEEASIEYTANYKATITDIAKTEFKYPDSLDNYKEVTDMDILNKLKI